MNLGSVGCWFQPIQSKSGIYTLSQSRCIFVSVTEHSYPPRYPKLKIFAMPGSALNLFFKCKTLYIIPQEKYWYVLCSSESGSNFDSRKSHRYHKSPANVADFKAIFSRQNINLLDQYFQMFMKIVTNIHVVIFILFWNHNINQCWAFFFRWLSPTSEIT